MTEPRDAPRPYRRRVLLNTASSGAANVWAIVVTLVSLPLLLNGLGADVFGTWILLQTFSAINGWVSLADLGMAAATSRAVAQHASHGDHRGAARTIGSSLAVFAGLGLGCAFLLATVGRRWLPTLFDTPADLVADLQFAIVLFAVQIVADLVIVGVESALEGLQRVDLSRGVDVLRRTTVAVATSAVAMAGGGLRGVALASLVVTIPSALAAGATLWRYLQDRHLRVVWSEMRALLRYGKTVAVLRPFGVIQRTMDRLIVGVVLGPAPVALVEIATQIQNGADAVLSASSYSVLSSASWLRAREDKSALRELLDRGTKYSLLVTMPFVTAPALLAGPLVNVWVGNEYAAAAALASVGLLYVAATAPLSVGSNLLVGVGNAAAVLKALALAVAVNFVASVILVHVMGTMGVFVGTLIGTSALLVPLGRAAIREAGSTAGDFVRSAVIPVIAPNVALAVVAGAALLAPLGDVATLVLGFGLGGVVYAVAAVRWTLGPAELRELKSTLRRASTRSPAAV